MSALRGAPDWFDIISKRVYDTSGAYDWFHIPHLTLLKSSGEQHDLPQGHHRDVADPGPVMGEVRPARAGCV